MVLSWHSCWWMQRPVVALEGELRISFGLCIEVVEVCPYRSHRLNRMQWNKVEVLWNEKCLVSLMGTGVDRSCTHVSDGSRSTIV